MRLNVIAGKAALLGSLAAALFSQRVGFAADASGSDSNWPSYFGNNRAWSYSALDQINRQNVGGLAPAWAFSTGEAAGGLTSTPLVIDGVMYVVTATNSVFALDAATGRVIWRYLNKPSEGRSGPRKPLGLAAGFGLIYLPAADHRLIAIDQKTGEERWNVEISDPRQCGCGPGVAPLLVKDKVILGVTSLDTGHRGYIDAFDAKTGRHAWRFWSIPGPGEPNHDTWPEDLWRLGTTSTWLVGSYDPDLNTVYWGMGNPGPMIGGNWSGRKLYSESVVALDPDTGKLKWYFQHIPNDKLDFDSTLEPLLIDKQEGSKVRKLLVQPTKSGFAYVLDRVTGKFIHAYPVADTINWTKGLDKKGMPLQPVLQLEMGKEVLVCPGVYGARAAGHSSYNPKVNLFYNTSYETCTYQTAVEARPPQEGVTFNASSFRDTHVPQGAHPFIGAFDPLTGERKWSYPTNSVNIASLMSTGGELLFGGDVLGNAWALDAATGTKLWSFNIGTGISSTPISFAVNGKQYIAIAGGLSWVATALTRELLTNEQKAHAPPSGSVLFVFALPGNGSASGASP